jgi:beta-ureidopropionase
VKNSFEKCRGKHLKKIFCRNKLEINDAAKKIAADNAFEIASYGFEALKEDLRKPKIVKIGAVQNSIVKPTNDSIHAQRDAIFEKIGKIIDAAGADGVNVLCLQEAWSKFS